MGLDLDLHSTVARSWRSTRGTTPITRWDEAGAGYNGVSYPIPPEDLGNWVHLVGTADGTGWRLYRNGTQVAFAADTAGANDADGGWAIGARHANPWDGPDRFFNGSMDNVAVYDYAITPAQVAKHYTTAGAPSVSIGKDGANVVVSWNKGLLLQAPAATGPWTTNTTAVSPWTNAPAGTQQFYRALVP